jgi:hypothetical protein
MVRALRSYLTALKASRRFGQASRLRDRGKKTEALSLGREALLLLAQPHVVRTNPAEAAVLASATVLVEGLASELEQPGATARDVDDSLQCIRALGPSSELAQWVPFLEWRSKQRRESAV